MDEADQTTTHAADSAAALDEAETRREEVEDILQNGPRSANRSGAMAFLAFLVIVAAATHLVFSTHGGAAYLQRLDTELLNHAELSLAALEGDRPMAIAPSWPLRLYENLRRDIVLYCALAAVAAYLWTKSACARARRDAYLVHEKLTAELADLRARLNVLEPGTPDSASDDATDRKG